MSSVNPPNQYFPTIIYNPAFWTGTGSSGLYLGRTGTPTSVATNTTFTGAITATDLTVANVIQGTANQANNVNSTNNNANQTHYLTYVDNSTNGYGGLQKHATLTFNPNQEILTADNINATTTLQIAGSSLYSIFLTISNAVNDYARLAYNNTFLGTNHYQSYLPTVNASLYPNSIYQLAPVRYVDDSFASVFSGSSRAFLNAIFFTNYCPSTSIAPVYPNDLVNRNYIDNLIGLNTVSNTWSSSNEFVTALRTSVTPVATTDVVNKTYADTNLSNATLKSSTNTFTALNTFSNGLSLSGGSAILDVTYPNVISMRMNGSPMLQIDGASSGYPLTINSSTGVITMNYYFVSNSGLYNNTFTPLNATDTMTFGSSHIGTLNMGNASGSVVNTYGNNTFNKITLAGKNLFSCDSLRTTAFTISSPFFAIYPVAPTANLVITLPVASATYLGTQFVIRRTGGTSTVTINSASANIYPTSSFTAGTSILAGGPSAGYTATIACSYLGASTYGWFII